LMKKSGGKDVNRKKERCLEKAYKLRVYGFSSLLSESGWQKTRGWILRTTNEGSRKTLILRCLGWFKTCEVYKCLHEGRTVMLDKLKEGKERARISRESKASGTLFKKL